MSSTYLKQHVKIALREALRPSKKPRGRPKTTYLPVIKTQLKERHKTLEDAMIEAKDKVASNRPGPKFFSE